ncbi:GATA transcription factor 2-like [Andrographis paniculata]|uniref:GATA transcription factor 2-like n=1 Tax=Andrographis paniculata TaxID=175694 RepID=UPI0021E75ED3|nr:GATA transcription factor 2-like [Andrographis paniculata]
MTIVDDDKDINKPQESQLCIPWDNLDDLEFYPNFTNNLIYLSSEQALFDYDDGVEKPVEENAPVAKEEDHPAAELKTKKPRSKGVARKKRSINNVAKNSAGGFVQKRRCKHCDSEETPQWRAGPMGPKTLCNACGVRYKSGRLLPEYRPAASPSFDASKHSNYHRKVISKVSSQ